MNAAEQIQHLQQNHGVMLTRREVESITVSEVAALWIAHGPHSRCNEEPLSDDADLFDNQNEATMLRRLR